MSTVYRVGSVRPRTGKPVLRLRDFLTAAPQTPIAVPDTVDDTVGVTYALDENDRFGDCVPTGFDELRRTVTKLLTGTEVDATWTDIVAWYRSQNPRFDENDPGGPGDQGMVIQDFLAWLVKQGLILGFAAVDPHDETEFRAALYLFLAVYAGATLQEAQQAQTDAGRWDYVARSPQWGGHCVTFVAYGSGSLDKCITWGQPVDTTASWRQHCLDEAYVVILPEHVAHPGFRTGFDLPKYAAAFEQITGRPFPAVGPTPPNPPEPPPPHVGGLDVAVQALRSDRETADWVKGRHLGHAKHVAGLVRAVLEATP